MAAVHPDSLAGLLACVPGLRAALLLDPASAVPLARAARDPAEDLALVAARAARLLEAVRHAGERLRQGPAAELVVEAEGSSLVLLALAEGTLCLLLHPDASPARAAFEARRALARA